MHPAKYISNPGSSSFITDAAGLAEQHIQYLPFGELFVSQRNNSFDSRYKFTAKELDNETNYTYFGARYYDSDISIWLSVDPMADQRSWLSPYNYCQLNPIGRIDPTGALDWEPVVSKNGEVGYRAEKGDNFLTFKSQYGLTYQQTFEIFNAAGIDPATHDLEGQSINGSAVKKVTGSDILKLNWNSSRATDQRKTDQIMFSIKKSQVDGKDYFDLKDYNDNMYNNGKGFIAKNVTINVGDKDIPISNINVTVDWNTKVKSTGEMPKQIYQQKSFKHLYCDPNGKYGAQRILITIDEKYFDDYTKFYY